MVNQTLTYLIIIRAAKILFCSENVCFILSWNFKKAFLIRNGCVKVVYILTCGYFLLFIGTQVRLAINALAT